MKEIKGFNDTEVLVKQRYQYFDKTENFDLADLFLNHGRFLPKPDGFDLTNTTQKFLEAFKTGEQADADIVNYENNLAGIVFSRKSLWGLKKNKDTFFIGESDQYLFYASKSAAGGSSVFRKGKSDRMMDRFEEQIRKEQELLNPEARKLTDNVLTRALSDFELLSAGALCEKDELLLAALRVQALKVDDSVTESEAKRFYYLLTDRDAALVGFNSKGIAVWYKEMTQTELKMHGFWFIQTIDFDSYSMQPLYKNAKFFKRIIHLNRADAESRLKEIITVNYEAESILTADNLMRIMKEKTGDSFYELSRLFVDFINHRAVFVKESDRDALFAETAKALEQPVEIEKYKFFLMGSGITHKERAVFLNLMLHAGSTSETYTNGLHVAEYIRTDFIKHCNSIDRRLMVDIIYAKYLLKAGELAKAQNVLEKIQKSIPEEELSLLMPAKDTDLLSSEGGKYLLTEMYELLAEVQPKKATDYLHYIAEVQPLCRNRLSALAQSKSKYAKTAQELSAVLFGDEVEVKTNPLNFSKLKSLKSKSDKNHLKHPAERKNGSMSYVQRWLKNNAANDYTAVKSYTEFLKPENQPELMSKLRHMADLLGLEKTEWYLADGDMADELVAYPGEPPFIVIGKQLIQESEELITVLAARQLAHILHGHAPVTAKDLWRAFIRNGQMNLDRFAVSVTTAGLEGRSITELERVNELTRAMHRSINLNDSDEKTEEALNVLYNFMHKPLNFERHDKDNRRIILAGRLLSVSADRAGLLFATNLHTAFQAIVYYYLKDNEEISHSASINEILNAKNNDGTYRYPELMIRILNLASFCLSEEYAKLVKALNR